jgi:hypothetical protein
MSRDVNTGPIETSVDDVNRLDGLIPNVESSKTKYDQHSLVGAEISARTRTNASIAEHSEKASIASYKSATDRTKFVKEMHGR